MAKKKKTKAQKNAARRQARYNRQYRDMIANYKHILNDLQLATVMGSDTPSAEKILNYAGTKSGLSKPSKKSIQALKKLQTKEGVLRQIWLSSSSKTKGFEEVYSMFEKERAKNQPPKKQKKKKDSGKKDESPPSDKTKDQEDQAPPPPPEKDRINAIDVLIEQIEKVIRKIRSQRFYSNADQSVLFCGEDLLDKISFILDLGESRKINKLNEGAIDYFSRFHQVEYDELYSDAPNIRAVVLRPVYEVLTDREKGFFDSERINFDDMDFFQ